MMFIPLTGFAMRTPCMVYITSFCCFPAVAPLMPVAVDEKSMTAAFTSDVHAYAPPIDVLFSFNVLTAWLTDGSRRQLVIVPVDTVSRL